MEWCRTIASCFAAQALVQVMGFFAGILVVRSLPKEDYAIFVIVNTFGPIISLLSDNGIISSLSAIGGRFWQDDARMGSLVKTAMILRRQLLRIIALVISPILVWMLWRSHASTGIILSLLAITLTGVLFQINVGVLGVLVSLRQQVGRMQIQALCGVVPRLALIALFAAAGILNAPLAVAAATVATAAQFWLLKRWVKPQIAWDASPDSEFRREILAIVKRQAPLTIYFCLQGQIGIWLISIFGNAQRVAEVGALGRVGMMFSILISPVPALVLPRFARCQDPALLRSRYLKLLLVFSSIILGATLFSKWVPGPLLWLLGPKYDQLGDLVWLAVLATASGAFSGLLYTMNVNKGWIPPASIVIPAEIVTQIVLCLSFDISSVRGILMISLLAPVSPSIINLCFGLSRLRALNRAASMPA
jgi:O-antigen/teichoic acid export membrane protein